MQCHKVLHRYQWCPEVNDSGDLLTFTLFVISRSVLNSFQNDEHKFCTDLFGSQ